MVATDRGQLLLLGGLAMAIVFLAVIPLSNSLVVTESAATSDTVREIDRTADRQATVERAIRTLANRTDAANNTDAFNRSLQNYSLYRRNVSGQQSGVYVNASINVTASGQTADNSDFEEPGTGNKDWDVVTSSEQVSEFNITVDDAEPSSEFGPTCNSDTADSCFRVSVTNASGDEWLLTLGRDTGSTDDVYASVNLPDSGSWNDVCNGQDYTIEVQAGTCTTGQTFQSFTDTLTGPYTIRYEEGDEVEDSYWNLTSTGDPNSNLDTSLGVPYVDVEYHGPDTSYERTISVQETT